MSSFKLNALCLSILSCSVLFTGCNDHDSDTTSDATTQPPKGLGYEDTAPVSSNLNAVVDSWATNQRGDARYATVETNAGVRVLSGYLDVWTPSSLLVDAGVSAEARDGFPAVKASNWTGIPGDSTDGTKKMQKYLITISIIPYKPHIIVAQKMLCVPISMIDAVKATA